MKLILRKVLSKVNSSSQQLILVGKTSTIKVASKYQPHNKNKMDYNDRKYDDLWMDIAFRASLESRCTRRKVGAIAVKEGRVISIGWNGTYPGHDNECEEEIIGSDGQITRVTKPTTIHAEANMLGKLAGCHESARDAIIYSTDAPCLPCAMELAVARVREVVYSIEYRNTAGVEYLRSCGIPVSQHQQQ